MRRASIPLKYSFPRVSRPPRASRICPRPLSLSVLHFEHSVDTGTEEQSNRRINPPLNTLQHAGGPGGVKYTVPMSGGPKALSSGGPKSRGPRAPKSVFYKFGGSRAPESGVPSLLVWVVLGPDGLSLVGQGCSPSIPEVSCFPHSQFSISSITLILVQRRRRQRRKNPTCSVVQVVSSLVFPEIPRLVVPKFSGPVVQKPPNPVFPNQVVQELQSLVVPNLVVQVAQVW